jgi:hypothetical protein
MAHHKLESHEEPKAHDAHAKKSAKKAAAPEEHKDAAHKVADALKKAAVDNKAAAPEKTAPAAPEKKAVVPEIKAPATPEKKASAPEEESADVKHKALDAL